MMNKTIITQINLNLCFNKLCYLQADRLNDFFFFFYDL